MLDGRPLKQDLCQPSRRFDRSGELGLLVFFKGGGGVGVVLVVQHMVPIEPCAALVMAVFCAKLHMYQFITRMVVCRFPAGGSLKGGGGGGN